MFTYFLLCNTVEKHIYSDCCICLRNIVLTFLLYRQGYKPKLLNRAFLYTMTFTRGDFLWYFCSLCMLSRCSIWLQHLFEKIGQTRFCCAMAILAIRHSIYLLHEETFSQHHSTVIHQLHKPHSR